jgi:hypothetical protein
MVIVCFAFCRHFSCKNDSEALQINLPAAD